MPSKERSSQNTMQRNGELRRSSIRPGRVSISSRWISISFSRSAGLRSALMVACAAFTSDDLPMPRAPHSNALLAGSPLVNRSVFSIRMSRIRSTPLSRPISTRLTRGTGARRPSGCQTKASAAPSDSAGSAAAGEAAARRLAMLSRALAIRSAVAPSSAVSGRFVAAFAARLAAVLGVVLRVVLLVDFLAFFGICPVPDGAALSGWRRSRKRPK